MPAGNTTVVPPANPRTDEAFQKLLLRISEAAAQGTDAGSLIQLFCRDSRQFFQVSGTYFWRCLSSEELIGAEADGLMAEQFRGSRLKASQSAVAADAVRLRRTVFVNQVDPQRYPMAGEYRARSIMAAPLVVSNEVIGAAVFLQEAVEGYFSEDLAAKATILAGQLGSLLEARRLRQASREEHRRAEILAEVAHSLHGVPDVAAVIEALADRVRILLRTRLVCVLLRQEGPFELRGVAAESPALATSVRARHDRTALRFSADQASRALAAGECITAAIDPGSHVLGELVPSVMLIAAPFRAAAFLGFGRCLTGLLEGGIFRIRWGEEGGEPKRVDISFPEGVGSRTLLNREVFWTDDPSKVPGSNLDVIAQSQVRQILAVPLLGSDGQ